MFRRLDSRSAQSSLPMRIKQRVRRRRVNLDVENLENRQLLAVEIWTGLSSNLWSDNGNWQDNSAPIAGDDLVFPSSATNKTSVYDSGLGVSSFGSIAIQDSGYDISSSFMSSLTLTSGLSATYGSSISNFDIDFDPGNGSVSVGSGATLELGGVISGIGGLSVSGGGTLQLAGTSSNTYTGTTIVDTGTTLVLDKTSATAVPTNLAISGTAQLAQSDQIDDSIVVILGPGATLDLNNFDDAIGALSLTGATVSTGSGTLTLGGDVTTNSDSTTSIISGNLDLGGATRTFDVANDTNLDPDLSITANISGTGAGLIKAGANSQLLLSGNNTYDGITTIAAGAIEIASNNALGASSAGTVVNSGFSLALLGGITVPEPITISGVGFGGLGAIFNGNGDNVINGGITLGANSTIGSLSGTLTFGGVIDDGGSSFALTKVCAGTVALTNANTYDGGTTITNGLNGSGALAISHGSALGTGSVSIANGSELDLSNSITLSNNIAFQGTGVGGNGALRSVSGDNVYSGTATILATDTRIKVDAGQLDISGDLTDGSNNYTVEKYGEGLLIASGTLTSVGLLNSVEGEVRVTGSYAGAVILAGGNISGTGTLGSIDHFGITSGEVNPGTGSGTFGTLSTLNGYDVITNGTTHIDIGGTTAGTTYDQIAAVTGGVTLTDSNIEPTLVSGFTPSIGDVFQVIDKQSVGAVTGTFLNLAEGDNFQTGSVTYQVSYVGGDGNDVTLTVVGVTYTWTGLGGDSNWSTAANWDTNTAPTGGEDLVFPLGALRLSNNNDLAANTNFNNITIAAPSYQLIGNVVDLDGDLFAILSNATSEIRLGLNLQNDATIDVDSGGLNLAGSISGAFGVTKVGAGNLTYFDTSSNTYTGTTFINEGSLSLVKLGGATAIAGNLTIGDNVTTATADYFLSNQIADTSTVLVNEGSSFNLGTLSETIDTITMQGATATIGSGGVLTVTTAMRMQASTNNVTSEIQGPGTLDLNGGSVNFVIPPDADLDIDGRISAVIQNGSITKAGAGVLALSGNNTLDGTITINVGGIQVESDNALGSSAGATTVGNSTSLYFSGAGLNIAEDINVIGTGLSGTNALQVISGDTTLTGAITSTGAVSIGAASGASLTFDGVISDGNSGFDFTIANGATGRTVLGGANTYAGITYVTSGYARLTNDDSLGASPGPGIYVQSGATLELAGGITLPATKAIDIAGLPVADASKIMSVSGDNTIAGDLTISGGNNVAFAVAGGTTLTLSGAISGSRDFDKNGTGTLLISGTSGHTGNVNVGDGTLIVNGSLASSNSVFVDGTLGGSGTVPAVTLSGIGTLSPSNSPGILSSGSVDFTDGSTFVVELDGTTLGTQYDQLDVTGTVTIGMSTLNVSLGYAPAVGDAFVIINNDGTDAVTGTFNGLAEGSTITFGIVEMTISYAGGTNNNDVVLTVTDITYTWDGGDADDSLWSSPDNWVGDVAPTPGSNLVFASGSSRLSNTNDFAADTNFQTITIAGAGYSISGNRIDLIGGLTTTYSLGDSEVADDIRMSADLTIDVATGGTLNLSGSLVFDSALNGRSLVKNGDGTLTYLGSTANTYNGSTTVNAGTLVLSKSDNVVSANGNVIIGDHTSAATVIIAADNQFWPGSGVTINEGSTFDVSTHQEFISVLTLQGGTVAIDTGGVLKLFSQLVSVDASGVMSQIQGSGALELVNAGVNFSIGDDATLPVDLRISTILQGSNATSGFFTSDVGTVALSGANAFDGDVSVGSGTVRVENNSALGSTVGTTSVASGATVEFSGNTLFVGENFASVDGTGVGNLNVLRVLDGDTTLSGTIGIISDIWIGADADATLTISGVIDDDGGTFGMFVKNGTTGRTVLAASNLFDGDVTTHGGFLRGTNDNAFGDPSSSAEVRAETGASLELTGGITLPSVKTVAISGLPVANSSKIINISGTNTIQGDVNITGGNNVAFDVASGSTLEVSGVISGSRDFDKNGTGTLILSGTNTHTGNVNVGDGTLLVNGSLATSNSIFVDGVLGGSGTVPNVTVSGIGTIAPGTSPGILSSGNVDFTDGSTFLVQLDGTTVGTQYDQLDVTGGVTIGAATLNVSLGNVPAVGDEFVIINNDGFEAVTGTFSGLAEGSTITIGLVTLTISYQGGTNSNDVVLTATDVTYTWDGGDADDSLWSSPDNWLTDVAPTPGSNLVFASGASRLSNTNDFTTGTAFHTITIAGADYALGGNAIQLSGGMVASHGAGTSSFSLLVTLTANQSIDVVPGGTLTLSGAIGGAYSLTKFGGGTLQFSALSSYTGGTTVDTGIVNLISSSASLGSGAVTVNSGATLGFDGSASLLSALFIGGTGVDGNGALRTYGNNSADMINGDVTLTSDLSVFVASTSQVSFNGAISGAFGISTAGSGTLFLGGSANNTFTGSFTQANSTVVATKTSSAIAIPGDLFLTSGTFLTQFSEQIADTATVYLTANSQFGLASSGVTETIAGIDFTGGTVTTNSSVLILDNGGTITTNASSSTAGLIGTLDLDGGEVFITTALGTTSNDNDLSITATIQNGSLFKIGEGNLALAPTTSNTFAGGTNVNAGSVTASKDSSFGTGDVATSNALVVLTSNITLANNFEIDSNVPAISNTSGANTLSGTITLAYETEIAISSATTLTLTGLVTDDGENYSLTKTGSGTLQLDGTNTYLNTDIDAGSLIVGSSQATGTAGIVSIASGASITQTATTYTLPTGGIDLAASTSYFITASSGDHTVNGVFNLNGVTTFDIVNSSSLNVAGVVGGSGSIFKSNTGRLILAGTNTFDGFVSVTGGEVSVTNAAALGTTVGTTSISDGATLNFNITGTNTVDEAISIGSFGNSATISHTTGTTTLSGDLTLQAKGIISVDGGTLTVTGVINDGVSTFGIDKTGAGTLGLDAANTYDGGTSIQVGILSVMNVSALGSTTGATTIADGARLDLNLSAGGTIAESLTVGSAGGTAIISSPLGNNILSGNVTLISTAALYVTADSLEFTGVIGDSSGIFGLFLTGTHEVILSGANTFDGSVLLSGGTLTVKNAQGLGSNTSGTLVGAGTTLTLDLAGTNTLNEPFALSGVGATISNLAGSNTLSGPMVLVAAEDFEVLGGDLTLTGPLSGSGGLNKLGTGLLTVQSTSSFAGNSRVFDGILSVTSSNALSTTNVVVDDGATLALQGGIALGVASITITGAGFNGVGALDSVSGDNTYAGTLSLLGVTSIGVDQDSLTLSGVVTSTGDFNKLGAGDLILSNSNNLSGSTTISDGSIEARDDDAFSGSSSIHIDTTGQLLLNDVTIAQPVSMDGSTPGLESINGLGTTSTLSGTISLNAPFNVGAESGSTLVISGIVDDGGTPQDIVKLGAGIVQFTNSSNVISAGSTLKTVEGQVLVTNPAALGDSDLTAENGGEFVLSGGITVTNDISIQGTGVAGGGAIRSESGSNTFTGPIVLTGDASLGIVDGSLTIDGTISDGGNTFGLTKAGAGTANLIGMVTYTGETIVQEGTLLVNTNLTSSSGVTVQSDGILGGTGTIGPVVVEADGTIAPGNSPGTVTVTSLVLNVGSTFEEELGGTAAGDFDQTIVTPGVTSLGDATLSVTLVNGYLPVLGDSFVIIDNQTGSSISGTFAGLPEGSTVVVGIYGFQISYVGGDGNDVALLTVVPTTTTLSSNASVTTYGAELTFTALVVANSGTATGVVEFYNGSISPTNLLGSGTVNSQGIATFTTTTLSTTGSPYSIVADFVPTGFFLGSTSSPFVQTINKATSTSVLASAANPSVFGQSVVITATLDPASPTSLPPSGTVEFYEDLGGPLQLMGTATLDSQGVASFTVPGGNLTLGSHNFIAVYLGDDEYLANSGSNIVSQVVGQASTTSAVSSTANPGAFGQTITLTTTVAAVAPGSGIATGTVSFFDGATLLGTAILDGSGQATLTTSSLSFGDHSITAVYSGDANYLGSTSSTFTQTINQASTTSLTISSVNPSVFGQSVSLTATVSAVAPGAGTATGTVNFFDGATLLGTVTLDGSGQAVLTTSSLSTGSHSLTAVYSGDINFAAGTSAPVVQIVGQSVSSVAISAPETSELGELITISGTVAAVSPGAGAPTGFLTFFDGATAIGSAELVAGSASLQISSLGSGVHQLSIVYSGDPSFAGSTSPIASLTVSAGVSSTTVSASASSTEYGQMLTFNAVVAVVPGFGLPTGTVTFFEGATAIGTVPVSGASATLMVNTLSVGSHAVTAVYSGDFQYAADSSNVLSQTVTFAATTTIFLASPNPAVHGQLTTFTAIVSAAATSAAAPSGSVSFFDGDALIGTASLVGNQATLTAALFGVDQTHAIRAVYSGDTHYAASTSASATQTLTKANVEGFAEFVRVSGTKARLKALVKVSTPGGGVPSGTIVFRMNGVGFKRVQLVDGQASVLIRRVKMGSNSFNYRYVGDSNYNRLKAPKVVFDRAPFNALGRPTSVFAFSRKSR